jgi:uncharacterized protein (TIGR03086 family)
VSNRDPVDELQRAVDQTAAIISRVQPDQADLSTPCSSFDVRALVSHVIADVGMFTATAEGAKREQREGDVLGEEWAGSFRTAADRLLAAWRRGGVTGRTLTLPMGEVPAEWSVGQQVADLAVHGWDIAKATGQSTDLDDELARSSLEWAEQNLRPQFRGDEASGMSFGPEVSVPEDAAPYDRLAGFFGRDPGWTAPASDA